MPLNSDRRKLLTWLVPEEVIVNRNWLTKNRLDRHAIDNLVKAKQLNKISNGVYSRGDSAPSWQAIVYSLQHIFNYECVVGGLTALELHGLSQYMTLGKQKYIQMYVQKPLPSWVQHLSKDYFFRSHNSKTVVGQNNLAFTTKIDWKSGMPGLVVSTPERAILEVILELPEHISFEHADELVQGLTSLSPQVLQQVLEKCTNVKVKRVFLWLAERYNYPWLSKLNLEKIDLGSGNRMLVKGGKLNMKYKISVPETL
jgi:hypothetical protein